MMDIEWNVKHFDPQNLIAISRGDKCRMLKYLNQFQELIPMRIESLKENLEKGNRKKIRQILHQMYPQLQFFGVPDILTPIRRLEHEYETMPMEELHALINNILISLDAALNEVEHVLNKHFK